MRMGTFRSLAAAPLSYSLRLTDVARVQAQAVGAGLVPPAPAGNRSGYRRRWMGCLIYSFKAAAARIGDGDAHDLAAARASSSTWGPWRIAGIGLRHRLDDDGRAAADGDAADVDGFTKRACSKSLSALPFTKGAMQSPSSSPVSKGDDDCNTRTCRLSSARGPGK